MKSSLCLVILGCTQILCTSINTGSKLSFSRGNQNVLTENEGRVPGENPLDYCSQDYEHDLFQLDYVNLSPNPPEKGKELSIEAVGELLDEVEKGAYVRIKVSYGLIGLLNTQLNLCDQVSNVDLECPIKRGPVILKKNVKLPSEVPPGVYTVSADAYTRHDERLLCLTSRIKFNL